MRRALLLALVVAAVLTGANSTGDEPAAGPGKALSYVPAKGAIVVALSTDLQSEQFRTLDERVVTPVLDQRLDRLLDDMVELEAADVSWEDDVRPQLGNDLVVGARSRALLGAGGGVVAALQVKDGDRLRSLLSRQRTLRADGEANGARLYAPRGTREALVAVEEDMLVLSDSERRLRRALARHDNGNGMTAAGLARRLGDLPQDGLVRVVGDPAPLLSARALRRVRRIRWVRAIHSFAATLGLAHDRLRLDGALDTDAGRLSEGDLPLQAGDDPPALVRTSRQIASASANQSQTTVFLLRAARAVFPRSRFVRDVALVEKALGIDFEREVLRQFNGPSASLLTLDGRFAARSSVRNPRRLARTIRRLAPDLGRLVQDLEGLRSEGLAFLLLFAPDAPVAQGVLGSSRVKVRRLRGQRDFYRMTGLTGDGPDRLFFGLHKGVFVIGSSERRAKAIANTPAQPPSGVRGASVMRADLGAMRRDLRRFLDLDPGRLGEMVGSLSASRQRLRGSLSVELGRQPAR